METVENIFAHFGRSEERLCGNAAKARIIIDEINAMESLAEQLRAQASCFQTEGAVIVEAGEGEREVPPGDNRDDQESEAP
jgi:hypothetical protein